MVQVWCYKVDYLWINLWSSTKLRVVDQIVGSCWFLLEFYVCGVGVGLCLCGCRFFSKHLALQWAKFKKLGSIPRQATWFQMFKYLCTINMWNLLQISLFISRGYHEFENQQIHKQQWVKNCHGCIINFTKNFLKYLDTHFY